MSLLKEMVQWKTNSGRPVSAGEVTVTPLSRALVIRLGSFGRIVWNRPTALLVERGDAPPAQAPVVDVTRMAQWMIYGVCIGLVLLSLAGYRLLDARKGDDKDE